MVRETPLHLGHIRAMAQATEAGGVIMPPVPALYAKPRSVDEIIEHSVVALRAAVLQPRNCCLMHNGMIYKMWRERGEPMPFALVQGAEPAALFAGGMPLAEGVDFIEQALNK